MSVVIVNNRGRFLCGEYRKEKAVSEFKVGDKIAHTCDVYSVVKEIHQISKCFMCFTVDKFNTDGTLSVSNELSRRFKSTLKLHYIEQ